MDKKFEFLKKNYGGLVTEVTKKFTKNNDVLGYEDLMQEANMEMIHAYDRFDSSRGMKLSTYIAESVKHRIMALRRKDLINKKHELGFCKHLESKIKYCQSHYKYSNVMAEVKSEVKKMTKREQKIMKLRLLGKSYEEISKEFGITKQAISLIFNKMLDIIDKRVDINV